MPQVDYEEGWTKAIPWDLTHYNAEELEDLPTLAQGQADDLKFDDGEWRVWLCRCDTYDGMPYNDMITVEGYDPADGKWKTAATYPG